MVYTLKQLDNLHTIGNKITLTFFVYNYIKLKHT